MGNINNTVNMLCYFMFCRSTFSPIFSSGKLRKMTPLLQEINKKMYNYVLTLAKSEETFETKDLAGKFSLDGIATCAFGVEAGSFDDEEPEFLVRAKNVFKFTKSTFPKLFLSTLSPNLIRKLAVSVGLEEKVIVWETETGRILSTLKGHTD